MPNFIRREYWDTCLLIAYLRNRSDEQHSVNVIDALLRRAQVPSEGILLLMSAQCISEIRQRSEYDSYRWEVIQDIFYTDRPFVRIVSLTPPIAKLASAIGGTHNALKPMDCGHLATAITERADIFYTLDGNHEHGNRRNKDILVYDGMLGAPPLAIPLAIKAPTMPPNAQGRLPEPTIN